jgi:predicted Zn-dependent protease
MGAVKQAMIEERDEEVAEADRKHDRFCRLCDNELSREECEAFMRSLRGDD